MKYTNGYYLTRLLEPESTDNFDFGVAMYDSDDWYIPGNEYIFTTKELEKHFAIVRRLHIPEIEAGEEALELRLALSTYQERIAAELLSDEDDDGSGPTSRQQAFQEVCDALQELEDSVTRRDSMAQLVARGSQA